MRETRYLSQRSEFGLLFLSIEFCEVSWHFQRQKHLLCKTPLELLRQFLAGRSVIACDGPKIIGHVTIWPLLDNWGEGGSLWVRSEYRGRGLARELMRRLIKIHADENVLYTTTNEIVKTVCRDVGLRETGFFELPEKIHRATCTCSVKKMGTNGYLDCRLKDVECKLFVN